MYWVRRATILVAVLASIVFLAWFIPTTLNPVAPNPEQKRRDKAWVSSSPYWIDRQACRWLGVCGIHHMRWDDPSRPRGVRPTYWGPLELKRRGAEADAPPEEGALEPWEVAGRSAGEARIQGRGQESRDIPDYVLAHAPLVHLCSDEHFWPADIAEHVQHMTPFENGEPMNTTGDISISNLFSLNAEPNMVFLTSKDDVEERPEWLFSNVGVPEPFEDDDEEDEDGNGRIDASDGHKVPDDDVRRSSYSEGTTWYDVSKDEPLHRISDPRDYSSPRKRDTRSANSRAASSKQYFRRLLALSEQGQKPFPPPPETPGHKPNASGYSTAPAVLVMVDKGSGILDTFWFFFYSYNLGQTVLNMRFGNHVGDWEHCMIRFESGVPRALFLSEHEGGQAYAWRALEKRLVNNTLTGEETERPVIYSAVGSHAMYAFPGPHAYVLPFKMLKDVTDRGPLWDPSLNNYAYFYDYTAVPPPDDDDKDAILTAADVPDSSDEPYPFDVDAFANRTLEGNVTKRGVPEVEPPSLFPASSNPDAPTSWFHFDGPWGDEVYSLGDDRQWRLFGQYHYVTGPLGPKFKRLDRSNLCQTERCRLLRSIEEGKRGSWYS